MKVELTPDAAQWVEAELDAGHFPTAEDAVRYAINHAKISQLRAELEAAEAEGGSFTTEEVRRFARKHLDSIVRTHSR
ncbi:MAG: hypothetical protein HQK88_12355 [Nitrospirae bacterium]|nr:hypothetical protein [Nitrospirota bacterium]MBF0534558.1 hypothetical protein [Nitrospirota bacterium]MBF0617593.1 hypothetical protein [Nitrospirota bacterium]